jgi:hypothetical protein
MRGIGARPCDFKAMDGRELTPGTQKVPRWPKFGQKFSNCPALAYNPGSSSQARQEAPENRA